jgi:prepilin-type N-terminal cleavage/methylation domain-containing protein
LLELGVKRLDNAVGREQRWCMTTPRSRAQTLGFSLIELLIVIAIIAVLASLLMGSLSSTRRKAKVVESVANLRSIAAATRLLANENNGRVVLYGDPNTPTQTQGTTVATRGNQIPRALFARTSQLGGHSGGTNTNYLPDSRVFHNSRLRNFTAPVNATEGYGLAPDGRQNIGYYYYSLPSNTDPGNRAPMTVKGQVLSNDRLITSWGRTPLYSDIPDSTLQRTYGLDGDEIVVVHLDGSVSIRSRQTVNAQPSAGWRIYYMATGETQ